VDFFNHTTFIQAMKESMRILPHPADRRLASITAILSEASVKKGKRVTDGDVRIAQQAQVAKPLC
jgi:hypothetical protein